MKARATQNNNALNDVVDDDGDEDEILIVAANTTPKRKTKAALKGEGMRGNTARGASAASRKRSTVFDLDGEVEAKTSKVTSADIQSLDPACKRAQSLLEMNRKVRTHEEEADNQISPKTSYASSINKITDIVDDDDEDDDAKKVSSSKGSGKLPSQGKATAAAAETDDAIVLKLRDKDHSISAKIYIKDPLHKALAAFCKKFKLDVNRARMEVDGEVVGPKETAEDYDLEDRAVVDIFEK